MAYKIYATILFVKCIIAYSIYESVLVALEHTLTWSHKTCIIIDDHVCNAYHRTKHADTHVF